MKFLSLFALLLAPLPALAAFIGAINGSPGTSASSLVELDPATGSVINTIGSVGYRINGLAIDPSSGIVYATTTDKDPTAPATLLTINLSTGAGTPLPNPSGLGIIQMPVFLSNGDAFVWTESTDDMATFDKATGIVTVLGDSGINSARHSFFRDENDRLLVFNEDNNLYEMNATTGASTLLLSTPGPNGHHGKVNFANNRFYSIEGVSSDPRVLVERNLADLSEISRVNLPAGLNVLLFTDLPGSASGPAAVPSLPAPFMLMLAALMLIPAMRRLAR